MNLDLDDIARMVVEIETGTPPSLRNAEADAMRERLKVEIAEIHAKGGTALVPYDLPFPDYTGDSKPR